MTSKRISEKTAKIVWARAAGLCSYPDCFKLLIVSPERPNDPHAVLGEIAHIVGHSEEGPRGEELFRGIDRDSPENLLLLCAEHHTLIDQQQDRYSTSWLYRVKDEHEKWVRERISSNQHFPQLSVDLQQVSETLSITNEAFDVRNLLAGQLAASSIAMYKRDVAAYLQYAQAHTLEPLHPLTLAAWRDNLALDSTMSPNTINRMLSAVKRIIKQAASKELIDETISFKFQNIEGVKVKALKSRLKQHGRTRISPEDMRILCQIPDANTLAGKRDQALLATLATSGLRASELANLTSEQIQRRGKGYYLQVIGKTDTEPRDAHLSVEAYHLIQVWLEARPVPSPYVFTSFSTRVAIPSTNPISEVTVWNIVRKYAAQCGLEHIKPHDFRRFVGTQLASKDIRKAQLALGHKSIEVTARHYVLDELEIGLTDNLY